MAIQPTIKITAELYFQSDEYKDHELIQLIDGEVVISMPPVPKHQRIVRELLVMFTLLAREIGGEALVSPIEVYLDDHNIYEPDVIYLTPDSNCTVKDKRLEGAPELVVEVLSPGTAKYDKREKYAAYERHGVKEYWIVDPVHELVDVWVLDDSKFVHQGAFSIEDTFASVTLNVDVEVKPLFEV